jgi:hypothetical protein
MALIPGVMLRLVFIHDLPLVRVHYTQESVAMAWRQAERNKRKDLISSPSLGVCRVKK